MSERVAARSDRAGDGKEHHYRAIFESAVDFAIIATDRDGLITDWNTGAEQIFGWAAAEMRGQPLERFFTMEDQAEDRAGHEMRRSLERGRGNDERWHVRKDGARFWANGEMMPLRDEAGRHIGFLEIVRDETERRIAAERQRDDQAFLQNVLAASDDCVKVLDLEGNLVFMSEGGQRVMQVPDFEAVRGRYWPDFWRGDLNEQARASLATARAGGTGHFQGITNTFAGTPRWWDVRVKPLPDPHGKPEKLLAISRDITEAKQADQALRASEGRLRLALQAGRLGFWELDIATGQLYVSDTCKANFGRDPAQPFTYDDLRAAIDPEDRDRVSAAIERTLATGEDYDIEYRVRRADGTVGWVLIRAQLTNGTEGEPERLAGVSLDLTDRKLAEGYLARSQERLNLALGAAGMVGIWDWDLKHDVIYADANFARIYTVDPAWAARGAPLAEFIKNFHPDDLPAFEAGMTRLFAGEDEFSNEYRILQPDGSVRWLLARGRLVRDPDGTPLRFPGASVDITERKEAEARRLAILDLGDRLRDLTDPADMAYTAAKIMGQTLDVDRAGYGTVHSAGESITIERDWSTSATASIAGTHSFRSFGSFVDDLKRGSIVVIDDAQRDPRTAANLRALESIGVRSVINLPVFEHGRFVALFYLHDDKARQWSPEQIAFVRNVADRTRAAIERRHAEIRLHNMNLDLEKRVEERTRERDRVWRNSQDLLVVIDAQGAFRSVNPAARTLLGWDPEDLLGRMVSDFVHPDDRADIGRGFHRANREDLPAFINRCRHKDGTYRWISWVAAPEEDLIFAYGRDITAERAQAAALHQAEEQLRQSQKMEAVGQLTGGVAHDFNNLLTVIRSSIDLLKRPDLAEDRRQRYIEAISDTTTRASKLTGQLLAFARRQALKPEVFDVVKRVGTMSDMVVTLTGSRIRIETQVPEAACFVDADSSQFDTALVNMVVNARDAMNGEGRLTIAVGTTSQIPAMRAHPAVNGDFVAVSITDTGSGIAPGDVDRIFEPFFTTKGVGHGTGLGLSQVFGFVKQSGGEVAVASELGQGTVFTLYLPRAFGRSEEILDDGEAEPLVDGHGTRVLVVEDNADVGSFATQTLRELGYETTLAADAEQALAELAREGRHFEVVFSDVVMPGMNGIELAQEIRRRHPGQPIVLTSGYSHVLAQNGTFGFELLNKPYSVEQLSRVLSKAAHGRRGKRIGNA